MSANYDQMCCEDPYLTFRHGRQPPDELSPEAQCFLTIEIKHDNLVHLAHSNQDPLYAVGQSVH